MSVDVEQVVRELIDKSIHMSLATTSENQPWVCEVHFAYDDNLYIYFVSKLTSRHSKEITSNSRVAGNIVKQHSIEESPNGVYFEGAAQLVSDPSGEDLETYCSRLGRDVAELKLSLQVKEGHRLYKIDVSNWAVFGKFGLDKNHKYELKWHDND